MENQAQFEINSDAAYVVHGMKQLATTAKTSIPMLLRRRNGDLWTAVQDRLERTNYSTAKVKAHHTIADVAAGKISFQSYASNAVADAGARAAARLSALPELTRRYAEWHSTLSFNVAIRIACTEEFIHANLQEEQCWQILMASGQVALHTSVESQMKLLAESGHKLRTTATGKVTCEKCGEQRSKSGCRAWIESPCMGEDRWKPHNRSKQKESNMKSVDELKGITWGTHRVVARQGKYYCVLCKSFGTLNEFCDSEVVCRARVPGNTSREVVNIQADLRGFRKEQKVQSDLQKTVDKINKHRNETARQIVAAMPLEELRESTIPPWSARVHPSHLCKTSGGFIFCNRCGSTASVPRSRSGLFLACPAAEAPE